MPAYYEAVVAEAAETPVLAYHFPKVSSPGIEPGALDGLGVVGVKDSSGDPRTMFATLGSFSGAYYPGSAFLVSLAAASGASGAILAVANIAPELGVRAFDGDQDAQRQLAGVELALTGNRWAAIKAATAELGLKAGVLKRDLGKVLLKLEQLQEQQIRQQLEPEVTGRRHEQDTSQHPADVIDPERRAETPSDGDVVHPVLRQDGEHVAGKDLVDDGEDQRDHQ